MTRSERRDQLVIAPAVAVAQRCEVPVGWGELISEGLATLARDWWEPEWGPDGEWFVWGGAAAEISLPAFPAGTALELDLNPASGEHPLDVMINGKRARQLDGMHPRQRFWVTDELLSSDKPNRVVFKRVHGYVPSSGDPRPLSVRLFGVRAVGPGVPWAGVLATEEGRQRCWIRVSGVLDPEEFPVGSGAWTKPEARLWLPAGPGVLVLTVWAPRPRPPIVDLTVPGKGTLARLEVGPDPIALSLPISLTHFAKGGVEMELRATPFCPAKEGLGDDHRELGVVISHARFHPVS